VAEVFARSERLRFARTVRVSFDFTSGDRTEVGPMSYLDREACLEELP
jgi:hypothetical protein